MTTTTPVQELFDVIIMDALDPVDFDNFADRLYNNTPFIQSLYNDLSPDGVLVVQLSVSPNAVNPSVKNRPFKHQANMISKLQHLGFQSIHMYEEGHYEFYHLWSILVAFKHTKLVPIGIAPQRRLRYSSVVKCVPPDPAGRRCCI